MRTIINKDKLCSEEYCKKPCYAKGLCNGHYKKKLRREPLKGRPFKDITGQRFGRQVAMWPCGHSRGLKAMWLCLCDCGVMSHHCGNGLSNGCISSCGCLQAERRAQGSLTHGMSNTPEYCAFYGARQRCNDMSDPLYGGRGIKFLYQSFEQFYKELGPKPFQTYSLDRVDFNGNYEPGNLRWADKQLQAQNRRKPRTFEMVQFQLNDLLVEYAMAASQ